MTVISVLVADAQALFADVVALALADKPSIAVCEERPSAASAAVQLAATTRPDVALVDYWLDARPAPAVAQAILEVSPETKLVHLSSVHGPEQVQASLGAGAVGFLPKSVRVNQVAEAVYRAYAGERPVFEEQLAALVRTIEERDRQAADKMERFASLTAKELEVVEQLARGRAPDEAADRLGISLWTVRTHVRNVLRKTGARTQVEMVAMAHGAGLAERTS